jgi:hypothetical protein
MAADEKTMSGIGVSAHGAYTLGGNFFFRKPSLIWRQDCLPSRRDFRKHHLKAKLVVGFGESHTNTLRIIIIEAQ